MKKIVSAVLLVLTVCVTLVACSSASDPLKRDVIIAGVRGDAPGFGYLESGDSAPQGFEVDLAAAIVDSLGKEIEYRIMADSSREPSLLGEDVDMVVAIYTITEERQQRMSFSQPYYTDYLAFMAREEDGYHTASDLAGKRIGTAVNTTPAAEVYTTLEQQGVQAEVVLYNEFENAVAAFEADELDALFMDTSILLGYMKDGWVLLEDKYSPQDYGIAVRQADEKFLQKIDQALAQMEDDGRLAALREKWELE